ncbi:6-carboxytetrahydropterin synthase [Marinimicrobium sp. ABcell2]|uniref:6-pyruvoyl trahydropterin synthase family protein n=1 Tax=Marinimicrobium sp. ABcell2 TaxID=3069751 RepID=UPI0027B41703|nr:6-carboxytetrahydropterin synthase [Marinimicrobium sp. ABcell2]MDQ2077959.1 6-carboxytetrahydropterin synthase [Marinimicrobium sp. ABcell2]
MLLFVDNLTNVDFSFLEERRGLLGETWLANVQLQGDLDDQGMVCDFGIVKKRLREWLDKELDHRLLVPSRSHNLTLTEKGDNVELRWRFGINEEFVHCVAPREALALVDAEELTRESVARWCEQQLKDLFPEIDGLQVSFNPEFIDTAFYHYSHGLKKHAGNCQRIAHGHRSRIAIWADDLPSESLENEWANRWRDVYLGTRQDMKEEFQSGGHDYYRFAYTSEQGYFELSLPQRCCELIDTDTTVECLAQHIAKQLSDEYPHSKIRVKAFEGYNKGAVAEA